MPTLAAAKAANSATKLPFKPVALFVGGTAGIGRGAAEAFARYTDGNAHIIICGRNQAAAETIIRGLPTRTTSEYESLQCDASRMEDISIACQDLRERGLTKLNYLFMSPGILKISGFDDNGEGIDKKMAVHFYGRFKFFNELAPLLQTAKDSGEEARIVTVLGAGHGAALDADDLGLKKSYGVAKCGAQSNTYSSLAVEELSKKYPAFSFTHIYPGAVKTSIADWSYVTKALTWLASPLLTSVEDCSEWMMRPLFDRALSKGAFHLDNHADPVPAHKLHLGQEPQTALYKHLMETIGKN